MLKKILGWNNNYREGEGKGKGSSNGQRREGMFFVFGGFIPLSSIFFFSN
jgi:hypothetical protein